MNISDDDDMVFNLEGALEIEQAKELKSERSDKSASADSTSFMFAPTDLNNSVFFGFLTLGFVSWFPCHTILVAMPFYTQSTEKYSNLIVFPLCIFLPTILSDYSVLLSWPNMKISFTSKVKYALSVQLFTVLLFSLFSQPVKAGLSIHFWIASLITLLIIGFCQATLVTSMSSLASVFPSKYTSALMFGGSFGMLVAIA